MRLFPDLARCVVCTAGRTPRRFYLGLSLILMERIFAIAPFFVAYAWLQSELAGGGSGVALATMWSDNARLLAIGIVLFCLFAAQLLCSYLGQLLSFTGAYELTHGYRERVLDHTRRLPLHIVQRGRVGQLAAVLTDDINRVEKIFTHLTAQWVAAVVVPLLFVIALVWVDWRLSLALMITLPLAVVALNAASSFFLVRSKRKQEQFLDVSGLLVEFVMGIRTLRLFNHAEHWWQRLDRRFEAIRHSSMGVEAWGGGSVQLYRFCLESALVVLLLSAAWLVERDDLEPLHWLLFAMLAYKLLDPLLDAAAFLTEARAMAQSEARIQTLLLQHQQQPPQLLPESSVLPTADGYEVTFESVWFRYDTRWVLEDVSFVARQGKVVAIVGASGSGKSTLLHLLARFCEPQQGRITLGGVDLHTLSIDRLYHHLSFVFQDVQLFDGSVLENVRIGRPEATDDEVMTACSTAYCDQFIRRLPQGYDTRIGENGQRLSGGERQRISIARALLKDAPVLLLDEVTASVDCEAQYQIQRALSHLIKGRTVVVIAHRLNSIRHADCILVLESGRIVEQGSHDELIQAERLYHKMWTLQNTVPDVF